jgi:tartrate-resistant acid phosphatase type 5
VGVCSKVKTKIKRREMGLLQKLGVLLISLSILVVASVAVFAYTLLKPVAIEKVRLDFFNESELSFLVVGDQGTGNLRQWRVASAMEQQAALNPIDAVFLAGDNFYRYGVSSPRDWQWRYKFENVYTGGLSATPFFATLGNHDYYGNELAQINYDLKDMGSGRWQMPARDYIKVFGRDGSQALLRVAFIDTGLWLRNPLDATSQLDALLKSTEPALWTVVVTHTPLLSVNTPDYRPEAPALWQQILTTHQVDLVLSGHDHNMQFIDQTHWPVQVIVGSGGKWGQPIEDGNIVGLEAYAAGPGFARMVVNNTQILLEFLDSESTVLFERSILRP